MSETAACPDPFGLDEKTRLALAVIFGQIQSATASPAVQLWANSCEDRLLGYDDHPAVPADVLSTAEVCAIHPVLVVAASSCDDKSYRQWLIDLGHLLTDVLNDRDFEQHVIDAKAAAIDAEEQARDRADRPPENLDGLPSWVESSTPKSAPPDDGDVTPK